MLCFKENLGPGYLAHNEPQTALLVKDAAQKSIRSSLYLGSRNSIVLQNLVNKNDSNSVEHGRDPPELDRDLVGKWAEAANSRDIGNTIISIFVLVI